tara:strand:- start:173 stop:1555 length:1383 start_codon:yes stop_codon:yes gene_type:complete
MSAIITSKFRLHNAEQFIESFSEAAKTTYYLFIGRPQPFGASIGGGTDSSPPTPVDTVRDEFSYFRDMIAAKNVAISDISYVVPRRNWTTGIVYDQYDHDYTVTNTSTSGATNLYNSTFYVMNSNYNVYKCMWNNSGGASTIEPSGTSTSEITTADSYVWKYMYSLTTSEVQNFLSTDFLPVSTDSTVSAAAIDGSIGQVKVTTAGTGYNNGTYPDVSVYGDGSSAKVRVTVAANAVSSIVVTTNGTGYTFANINIDSISGIGTPSVSAVATPIIGPKGGHGYNAVNELGAFYVMMSTSLVGTDASGDLVVNNDFRRIGLVRNPYDFGTTTICTTSTVSALKTLTFESSPTPGTFVVDEVITGATSGAKGRVVAWDAATRILKYIQEEWSGVDTDNNLTAFAAAEIVQGTDSSAAGTITSGGVGDPEIDYNSGDIIYLENRAPIIRATDQTETIRLVIEF